jgi:hypothetical protein
MANPAPLNDDDRAALVSYLDGELEPESARAIEARLARDPAIRAEADALRRAWDLLDYLPRPEPSPEFSQRTLESLAAVRLTATRTSLRRPTRLVAVCWAAALALAWLGGFAVMFAGSAYFHSRERADHELAHDLRLIENLHAYQQVDDIRLLQALERADLFGEASYAPTESRSASPGGGASRAPETPEAVEQRNRQLLDRWRTDSEHYTRLKRDLREFKALPEESRDRLRQLDQGLHDPANPQPRLQRVLELYLSWLDRLPEGDQRRIAATADVTERVRLIQQLRDREWIVRLPRQAREELEATSDPARQATRVAELRREEQAFRREWAAALRNPEVFEPKNLQFLHLADLPFEVQSFVRDSLIPALSPADRARLGNENGHGTAYIRTLVELADRYGYAGPGGSLRPQQVAALPENLTQLVGKLRPVERNRLRGAANKGPEFAIVLQQLLGNKSTLPETWIPSRPIEFDPRVQQFLTKDLLPVLTKAEKERLQKAEGHWPSYPQTLVDLARKRSLPVPGMTLPGPRAFWDRLSVALPEPPRRQLMEMWAELSPEENAISTYSCTYPSVWEQLKEAYYRRYRGRFQNVLANEYRRLATTAGRSGGN